MVPRGSSVSACTCQHSFQIVPTISMTTHFETLSAVSPPGHLSSMLPSLCQQSPEGEWRGGDRESGAEWRGGDRESGAEWRGGDRESGAEWRGGDRESGAEWRGGDRESGAEWRGDHDDRRWQGTENLEGPI